MKSIYYAVQKLSIFCLVFLNSFFPNASKAQDKLHVMFIRGDSLYKTLVLNKDSIIILQLKTANSQDFYADAWVHKKGQTPPFDHLSYFEPTKYSKTLASPFIYATMRWKYKEDPDSPIDATDFYFLIPQQQSSKVFYYLQSWKVFVNETKELPKNFQYEQFLKMDEEEKQRILEKIFKIVEKANSGSFNPIPPKLVP